MDKNNKIFHLFTTKLDKTDTYFDEQVLFVILKLLFTPPSVSRFLDYMYGVFGSPYTILAAFVWLYIHYNLDISTFIVVYRLKTSNLKKIILPKSRVFAERLEAGWDFFHLCYPSSLQAIRMARDYNDLISINDGKVVWGQQFDTPKFPRSKATLEKDLIIYLTKFRNDELKSEENGTVMLNYQQTLISLCSYTKSLLNAYKNTEIVFNSKIYLDSILGSERDIIRPTVKVLEGFFDLLSLHIIALRDIQDQTYVSSFNAQIEFHAVISLLGDPEVILVWEYIKKLAYPQELYVSFEGKTLIIGKDIIEFSDIETQAPFPVILLAKLISEKYPNKIHKKEAYQRFRRPINKNQYYIKLNDAIKQLNRRLRLKNVGLLIRLDTPYIIFENRP